MQQPRRRWDRVLIGVLALLLTTQIALAQTGGYTLPWWTIDGGGGQSAGGSYMLHGSIGQATAGRLGGGEYTLAGGLWQSDSATTSHIYLSIIVR